MLLAEAIRIGRFAFSFASASAPVLAHSLEHLVFETAGREVRDGFSSQLFPCFGNVLIPSAKLPCGVSLCGNKHLVEGRIFAVVVLKPA